MSNFSSEFTAKSSVRLSTKNAWALYVRRRWAVGGVKSAMAEWSLTEGEAKGLFSAQVSQPTIDKILEHPRGGFKLGLLILEIKFQQGLREFIGTERQALEREAEQLERESRELADLESTLIRRPLADMAARRRAAGVRLSVADRSQAAPLGDEEARQARLNKDGEAR